jgi:hypothetical protein
MAFAIRNDLVRLWRKDPTSERARVRTQRNAAKAFARADVSSCASVFGCRERFDNPGVLWYSYYSLDGTLTTEE